MGRSEPYLSSGDEGSEDEVSDCESSDSDREPEVKEVSEAKSTPPNIFSQHIISGTFDDMKTSTENFSKELTLPQLGGIVFMFTKQEWAGRFFSRPDWTASQKGRLLEYLGDQSARHQQHKNAAFFYRASLGKDAHYDVGLLIKTLEYYAQHKLFPIEYTLFSRELGRLYSQLDRAIRLERFANWTSLEYSDAARSKLYHAAGLFYANSFVDYYVGMPLTTLERLRSSRAEECFRKSRELPLPARTSAASLERAAPKAVVAAIAAESKSAVVSSTPLAAKEKIVVVQPAAKSSWLRQSLVVGSLASLAIFSGVVVYAASRPSSVRKPGA